MQLSQEGVKRIKQLEAQPAPLGQNQERPPGPSQAVWLITEQRPPQSSRTPGPQPDKGPWGRRRKTGACVHPHCPPPSTLPPYTLPGERPADPQVLAHILPDSCLGFSLSIPFRAASGLPKTLRVVWGEGLANLSLKPPETGPPTVPGTRRGVWGGPRLTSGLPSSRHLQWGGSCSWQDCSWVGPGVCGGKGEAAG